MRPALIILASVTIGIICGWFARGLTRPNDSPLEQQFHVEPRIYKGDPEELFREKTPPVSHGNYYLKVSEGASQYIWLFGAYNNGRREENVLIEKSGSTVRLRAWWLDFDTKMWCIDAQISQLEFDELLKTLCRNDAFSLPNLVPDVSHAMTYWVKFKDESNQHEACAYHVGNVFIFNDFNMFGSYYERAVQWETVVNAILRMRHSRLMKLRPSAFDDDGNVIWDLKAPTDFDTTGAIE